MIDEFKKTKKPFVLSVGGRKGGIGKSLCSLNLAYIYHKLGLRVLLVDADPQQSSTNILNINKSIESSPEVSVKNISFVSKDITELIEDPYEIDDLFGLPEPIEEISSEYTGEHDLIMKVVNGQPITKDDILSAIVVPTYKEEKYQPSNGKKISISSLIDNVKYENIPFGFHLLPSSEEIADDEMFLISSPKIHNKPYILKQVIDAIKKYNLYDIIIIDCPPSLGFMTLNAFTASDGTIVVVNPDEQSIFSLSKIKYNFREMTAINPEQKGILGVVFNMIEKRAQLNPIIEYKIKNLLKLYMFNTRIKKSINAPKANSTGRLFAQIDKRAESDFKSLAKEILARYMNNDLWLNQREELYQIEHDKILSDEAEFTKISEEAFSEMKKDLSDRGYSYDKQTPEIQKRLHDDYIERCILKILKEKYSNHELWDPCLSDYGKYKIED